MLRMGVFADSTRVRILDNRQVTGTLFSMVDAAELYILNNTRRAFVIDGSSLHRREVPEIPMDAVREALFNAFAHRLYEDDAAIQVDIFWDHIDIYSPGLFPMGLDPQGYLLGEVSSSKPRNKLIAATLYRSGDVEVYGTGLQRIKRTCDGASIPFSITQSKHGVYVSFMRSEGIAAGNRCLGIADDQQMSSEEFRSGSEAVPKSSEEFRSGSEAVPKQSDELLETLTQNERAAYLLVEEHGSVKTSEVAKGLGLSSRGALKVLKSLVDKGLVIVQGATSSRTYRIKP